MPDTDAARPDRDHHQRRSGGAQPLAGRLLPRGRRRRRCCEAAAELDRFRRAQREPLRAGPRALLPGAIYRYHLPAKLPADARALVPYDGYVHLLDRRFEEAVDDFLAVAGSATGPSDAIASALAAAYHALGFQTLADQVRRSVRSVRGNQWMFRMGHPADHPLEIRRPLLQRGGHRATRFPILCEQTPVRMDLSHSGWSDIFFLGMDFPEGARVLNVSVDLGVRGRDASPRPPIEVYLRVIDEPVLRLVSVDLKCQGRHHRAGRGVRFRQGLPGPAEGGRDRRGHRAAGAGRLGAEPGRRAGPAGRARAWGWRSSARSTTSPRARGWPSRPTCWRRSSPSACGPPGRSSRSPAR